jgi:cell division protein FtsW (lipid II flippase)
VQQRWVGFLDPEGHALSSGYDYQAITQAITQSSWLPGQEGALPKMSSPTDDYWLAAGCFRIGRLAMIMWVLLFLSTLLLSIRRLTESGEKKLLIRATAATLTLSLTVHAAYNLGFIPVTATYPPLAGLSGSISASQLFLIGYCLLEKTPLKHARD